MSNLNLLAEFVREQAPLCVFTGAGCSTPSGIYDYRNEEGQWKRPEPVYLQDFLTKSRSRRQYWARSMLGFPRFLQAQPNPAHHALAELEERDYMSNLITQNVDKLHEVAGQQKLVKLHGSLATVTCLTCGHQISREKIQASLERENQYFLEHSEQMVDGGEARYTVPIDETFLIPACDACGGIIKPDVVFFGDSVPEEVKQSARHSVRASRGVLLLGTTAQVYSCYRHVREADQLGLPIAAINVGKTRADDLLQIKLEQAVEKILPRLLDALSS